MGLLTVSEDSNNVFQSCEYMSDQPRKCVAFVEHYSAVRENSNHFFDAT